MRKHWGPHSRMHRSPRSRRKRVPYRSKGRHRSHRNRYIMRYRNPNYMLSPSIRRMNRMSVGIKVIPVIFLWTSIFFASNRRSSFRRPRPMSPATDIYRQPFSIIPRWSRWRCGWSTRGPASTLIPSFASFMTSTDARFSSSWRRSRSFFVIS